MNPDKFRCFWISRDDLSKQVEQDFRKIDLDGLAAGDVVVRVQFSSLNYKDALCATGNPGVARKLPTIPGIDAAGEVVESSSPEFAIGDKVLVAHADFGTSAYGGFCQYVRVPSDWVLKIPSGLGPRDAMLLGTAGFTAGQSIECLLANGMTPESGEIVVSGATGGVGLVAVKMLSMLGFSVVAATGKSDQHDLLKKCGASQVIGREDLVDESDRPLLKGRWAGAIDTVGGVTLATILKSTCPHGCVTACGLVGGSDLSTTVFPFILRGITLCGIDSAGISREFRSRIWQKLSTDWTLDLNDIGTEIQFHELPDAIERILKGQMIGRTIVNLD